jgi:DHA2 family multidrug resistance protein
MLQTLFGYRPRGGQAMAPRGLGSLIMMPLVACLRHIDPRLLAVGLTVGGITMLWLGQLNLQAGFWDIFWPQLLQGAGLSLLFVPLTTVSMATIAPERMGYATSLFNLMRNIGGGIGIAITGTMLSRQRQTFGAMLGERLTIYDPETQSMLGQLKAGFIAAGADAVTATNRAYFALSGMLQRQAARFSFVTIFRGLACCSAPHPARHAHEAAKERGCHRRWALRTRNLELGIWNAQPSLALSQVHAFLIPNP